MRWPKSIKRGNINLTLNRSADDHMPSGTPVETKRSIIKIAMVQAVPGPDIKKNLKKGEAFCRKAREKDADIVVFPEMYSIGYDFHDIALQDMPEALNRMTVETDGIFVTHFKTWQRNLKWPF